MKYLVFSIIIVAAFVVLAAVSIPINSTKEKAVIVILNESNFKAETEQGVIIVDFYADWCGPCRVMIPILEDLDNVKVGKVNIDDEQNLAEEWKVNSIPLFVIMKDGVEQKRLVGIRSKSELQQIIDDLNASE